MSFEVSPKTFTEQGVKPELAERLALVWHLRNAQGMTFLQIGDTINVGRQAAHIVFGKAKRLVESASEENKPWGYGLSIRALNVLRYDSCLLEGIERNKDAIKVAVLSGKLCLGRLRNCGKNTTKEILTWLGVVEGVKS